MCIFLLLSFSCQVQEQDFEIPNSQLNHHSNLSLALKNQVTNPLASANQLADYHNYYLSEILSSYNGNDANELTNVFLQTNFSNVDISYEDKLEVSNRVSEGNYYESLQDYLNPICLNYIDQAIEKVDNFTDVPTLVQDIESLKTQLVNEITITQDDKLIALATLATFQKSAEFWLPTELGGLGNIRKFDSKILGLKKEDKERTWKQYAGNIVKADGLSLASGFTVGGLVAGFVGGTVGVTAFFARIGLSAAFASSFAAMS